MMSPAEPVDFDAAEQARFSAAFEAQVPPRSSEQFECIALDWIISPVGPLLLGAGSKAIVTLEFASLDRLHTQLERLHKQLNVPLARNANQQLLLQLRTQLEEYFAGTRRDFDVPLELHGSDFQQRVWSALRAIPYGQTCSYAAIARTVGDPKAMRAVGMANGQNPIAIVIPCHRVVNASGELGGYGGGRWRKQLLLDLERGQGRLF